MARKSSAKERMMEAALALIWECSYQAASVEGICARAGVLKGSFYHFFASKAELAVAALEAQWEERKVEMDALFAPSRPPLERIAAYFDRVVERQTALCREYGRVLGCPLLSLGCEIGTQDRLIGAKVHELLGRNRAYFEAAIRDASGEGALERGGDDAAARARVLFAFYGGTLAQARIENSLEPIRALKAGAFELLGAPLPAAA